MSSIASSATDTGDLPRFIAVVMIPIPRGLVMTRTSPGLAPAFVTISSASAIPVTANPYVGWGCRWSARRRQCSRPRTSPPFHRPRLLLRARAPACRGATPDTGEQWWRTTHGIDVGQGIGRGDPSPVLRRVDDRCEDVDGLDQSSPVAQGVNPGVVTGGDPDEEVGMSRCRMRPD